MSAIVTILALSSALATAPQQEVTAAPALPNCTEGVADDLARRCPRVMREYFRSRGWLPSEGAISELDAAHGEILTLCTALAAPCEWRIDWYATAPDVTRIKEWIALLDADSRRLERFSRRDEACDRIVAMIDAARMLTLVARLDTQQAASRLAWQAIQRADAFVPLSADAPRAKKIRDACAALAAAQDLAWSTCVATEQIRWISRSQDRIRAGGDGASLYQSARSESAAIVSKANEYPLARLRGEELLIEMRAGEPYFVAAAQAWKASDATAQLAVLSARAQRGEFGAWMAAARPDFGAIRGELNRTRATLDALRDNANVRALESSTPNSSLR